MTPAPTVVADPPAARGIRRPESSETFATYLLGCRDAVASEMRRVIATRRFRPELAARLADYPFRAGKGLRPALCLATCRAFGGRLEHALPSAVALELFHNAFLVHDDIEDESLNRRGAPTMHQMYGIAIAVNVGDALNVLSMTPLLDNLKVIGLEKTLRVFREIERMARESVDGQAMELEWIKNRHWDLAGRDYHVMTRKKTCWYTCITPCRLGALIGGAGVDLDVFNRFGYYLGVAFQIQDDLLNLVSDDDRYGKEAAGDLWEGKRTLMLINLIERSRPRERERVVRIMSKPREAKTQAEIDWVLEQMHAHGCLEHGRRVSRAFARRAGSRFEAALGELPDSPHKRFLRETVDYVIDREL